MTNLEKCLMCFSPTSTNLNNLQQEMSNSCQLYKICCKYLHSIITKRNSDNCESESFEDNQNWFLLCQNCCDSAIKLADLANQLEFYQDCVSELILLFSLGILNRRNQFSPVNRNACKIIGIDATNLPDCYFLANVDFKNEPVSELQIVEGNLENKDPNLIPNNSNSSHEILFRENCDINDKNIEICPVEPNNISWETLSNTEHSKYDDCDNAEVNLGIKYDRDKLSPILKLNRIQIQVDGNKIIALDCRKNTIKSNKGHMIHCQQKTIKSIWNRTLSGRSFTITNDHSGSLQQISISTQQVSVGQSRRKQDLSDFGEATKAVAINENKDGAYNQCFPKSDLQKKSIQCSFCKKFLSSRRRLIRHQRNVHSNLRVSTPASVKCPICAKPFRSKQYLKFHLNIHTGEKPYRCNICEKTFAHQTSYKTHRYIHGSDKQRPHQCPTCEKGFTTKYALKVHSRRHETSTANVKLISAVNKWDTGTAKRIIKRKVLNRYQCHLCEKTFPSPTLLKLHQQHVHDNIKLFQCNVCKKSFVSKSNLELHSRIHQSHKDFKCDECPYEATRVDHIRRHKLLVHSNTRNFKCRECGKLFATPWKAKLHYKLIHFALEFNKDCYINLASNSQLSTLC